MRLTGRIMLFLAAIPALGSATTAAAKPAATWREVFQSSPSLSEPFSDEFIKMIIEEYKVPPAMIESMRVKPPVNGTIRFRFAVAAGGTQLRIRISNENGTAPLVLAAASVGLASDGYNAVPQSLKTLTFGGARSVSIAAGAPILSDPVDLSVPALAELVVSAQFPAGLTFDARGGSVMAMAAGDQTMSPNLEGQSAIRGRPFVTGAAVLTGKPPRLIVALGDSITDGNRDKPGALRSWPEQLNRRLAQRKRGPAYAVINAGIGGNRVLTRSWGEAALARLDRDALRIEGVSHIILLEGTNDIGMSGKSFFGDNPAVTAEQLIAGYRQIIARAHARKIKVVMGTILPTGGAMSHHSPAKEAVRQTVNSWIKTSGEPDRVIDFDQITRDPAAPIKLRKDVDSGDHLHPGEAGYRIMGDAIDLSVFD